MNFRSYMSGTTTNNFFPSGYSLLGSTGYLSGALSNLQADDGTYMNFRSYASATASNNFFPSGYSLLGSTGYLSGALSDCRLMTVST